LNNNSSTLYSLSNVYARFALDFMLVFGILGVGNLSHSTIFMLGSYAAFLLVEHLVLTLWLAMPTSSLLGLSESTIWCSGRCVRVTRRI